LPPNAGVAQIHRQKTNSAYEECSFFVLLKLLMSVNRFVWTDVLALELSGKPEMGDLELAILKPPGQAGRKTDTRRHLVIRPFIWASGYHE
jgi:hypothetical protein